MNVAAHQPVLPIAMFFHWNILYAEISDEERRELPKRSYEPALDLLSDHPRITAAIELSGATLQDLEQRHPQLIDKLKTLADRGQVELLGSTWQSPFLLDVREEHFARHVRMYLRLHTEIFGSHPEGLYTPEYCADERLPRILHEYGYTWFVAWVRHVAKHLPLRERERYVARDFIFPYAFEGDDKTRVFGLPLHGDEIDGMLNASDGTYPMEDYAEHIASFAALCADRSGIMIPGIADGEFLHEGKETPAWFRRVFEKHRHIQPEWLGRLWSIWENDPRLAFTTPSRYFSLHPPTEALELLPGGGFERNDLEHSATFCEPLRRQLRKLAAQVDLLQEKARRAAAAGRQIRGIRRKIERLSEQMLALEVSDLCRWHPGASKRAQGIAKARRALARGRLIEQEIDRLAA